MGRFNEYFLQEITPEWRDKYINYISLKSLLLRIKTTS